MIQLKQNMLILAIFFWCIFSIIQNTSTIFGFYSLLQRIKFQLQILQINFSHNDILFQEIFAHVVKKF